MNLRKVTRALWRMDGATIVRGLKNRWMERTFPEGLHHRDEVRRFERLYLMRDPWAMNCPRENFRFKETNRLIAENFGRPHSLLEIGCGEGLQSSELQTICDALYGLDISRRAVRRARRRCPRATLTVGDMYAFSLSSSPDRFDVVTACEVLYYRADISSALQRLSELGRACFISYYDGASERLDPQVRQIPGVRFEKASYDDVSWTFAWWRP